MKKPIITFLLVSLFIVSCSSNDDNSATDASLIGQWQIQSATYNGDTINDTQSVLFRQDGTVDITFINESNSATWTRNGTQLVLEFEDDPFPFIYEILELTESTLRWQEGDDGDLLIEVFTR